ncbi:MAG: endonuclease MutS2 [Clostridia bacterium]|nr:endonuclease MutS2 [Clostridia bacterium]
MNRKTVKSLEFDVLLERLASYTDNEAVKKRITGLQPEKELGAALLLQKQTTEAVSCILKFGAPPVNLSCDDVSASVKRAEMGGCLNTSELLKVSRLLYVSRRMKSYLSDFTSGEVLPEACEQLISAKAVEDRINSCILPDEQIADDASPELAAIRRRINGINGKIRESLNSMIRSTYKKYLQDPIVSVRNDRFVIPVRSEYKSEVPGIVHDTSSSGATLFIEPMSVVQSNNEIRDLKGKEAGEIERILYELSGLVTENGHTLFVNYRIICELDFWFCKGKFSVDYNGNEPKLNDKGYVYLKKARHPFIDKDKVVANDIILGKDYDTLVVTGPNTGGKTVTLKTVGLFSIMAASGLHIPASDGSEAAVFDEIFADIGDEQSIEQSLSTFSSHMVTIVDILKKCGPGSLALFDELGAGTDPTEGAALAVSILEFLRERGVKTLATTHYSELKLYALSTDGVENASCEFDVESLKPTYKLLIGVPGKSNAFAISKRLGLDERVIERANELLSDENIRFEDVITDLEHNRLKAESDMQEASRLKSEIKELRRQLESDRIKLKDNKKRIMDEAAREAKIIVMDAKEEANRIIRELEKMRSEAADRDKLGEKTKKARESLKKREDTLDAKLASAAKPKRTFAEPPKNLIPGTTVRIVDMNQEAVVLKEPDSKGMVKVQAGIINLDVHITNLKKVEETHNKELTDKYVKATKAYSSKTKNVSVELDVRGQMSEEAVDNVSKFIDDCYLASVSPITVIHGKGTGVLRKAIQDYLRRHKYVKSFRNGKYGEGEMGVTVIELK